MTLNCFGESNELHVKLALFPTHIAVVDDVITSGAHFRAAKDLLAERFPEAQIIGIFWARAVDVDS